MQKGGRGYPSLRPVAQIYPERRRVRSLDLRFFVPSSTLASPTITRLLLGITVGRPRAGCDLSHSQLLENRRPKFLEHVAAGNNPHLNSVSFKRLARGPLCIREIRIGQTFG